MIALGTLVLPRPHPAQLAVVRDPNSPRTAAVVAAAPAADLRSARSSRHLPPARGGGGHSPADGFHAGGTPPAPAELPGILLAALAGLGLGVVVGPEAPLIALGAGLGVCAVRLSRRDVAARAQAMVAASGSFAAISVLLGSPILGAFLSMESAGLGGATLGMVLLPGLLASGSASWCSSGWTR